MTERVWGTQSNRTLVCIDSYENGVPKGRLYNPYMEAESFESLSQFLIRMESNLEELQTPQSYTAARTFSTLVPPLHSRDVANHVQKGTKATFEIQVIFRQHTSWQGLITWQDRQCEQSFRSVLELVLLMDSALRDAARM